MPHHRRHISGLFHGGLCGILADQPGRGQDFMDLATLDEASHQEFPSMAMKLAMGGVGGGGREGGGRDRHRHGFFCRDSWGFLGILGDS